MDMYTGVLYTILATVLYIWNYTEIKENDSLNPSGSHACPKKWSDFWIYFKSQKYLMIHCLWGVRDREISTMTPRFGIKAIGRKK